jgi:catechol 2,3-dioxygenase-like lactoylglutathione lyase family enzyme
MTNIRHTGIVVTNIDNSIKFYNQYFGFEVKKDMLERGDYIDNFCSLKGVNVRTVKMALENGNMIELLDFVSHPEDNLDKKINQIGCTHIALNR